MEKEEKDKIIAMAQFYLSELAERYWFKGCEADSEELTAIHHKKYHEIHDLKKQLDLLRD